jgi:hypothetical protein
VGSGRSELLNRNLLDGAHVLIGRWPPEPNPLVTMGRRSPDEALSSLVTDDVVMSRNHVHNPVPNDTTRALKAVCPSNPLNEDAFRDRGFRLDDMRH